MTVYVGDSLESVGEASAALRTWLVIGFPFVILALGAVVWAVIGRALARLDRIREEVDRISEERLHTGVAGDRGRRRGGAVCRHHERHARPARRGGETAV